jgi:hypothetical protein
MIENGPIPAAYGVVRWRIIDLCQWLWEDYESRSWKCGRRCGGVGDAADITAIVDGIAIFAGRGDLSVPLRQGGRIVPPQAGKSLVNLSPGIAAESGNAAARGADQRREPASDIDIQAQR